MKLKKVFFCVLTILVTFFMLDNHVFADEYSTDIEITNEQIQSLDPYVSVENNQFVLNIPTDLQISQKLIDTVNQGLAETNKEIVEQNLIIDENTKLIKNPYLMATRANNGWNITNHWWGIKYTSYTQAGAIGLKGAFNNISIATTAAAGVLACTPAAVAGIIPALGGAYYQLIVSNMDTLINQGRAKNGLVVDCNRYVTHFSVYPRS